MWTKEIMYIPVGSGVVSPLFNIKRIGMVDVHLIR